MAETNDDNIYATMYCCGDVKLQTGTKTSTPATSVEFYQKSVCAMVELLLKLKASNLTSRSQDVVDFTVLNEPELSKSPLRAFFESNFTSTEKTLVDQNDHLILATKRVY